MRSNFYIKCILSCTVVFRTEVEILPGEESFKKMSLATTTATATKQQKSNRFRFAKQKLGTCITLFYISLPSLHVDYNVKLERLRVRFPPNGKREVVPHDQVFALIVVYCLLLLLKKKRSSFMLVLSIRIVLDSFYLLIFYSEKFFT